MAFDFVAAYAESPLPFYVRNDTTGTPTLTQAPQQITLRFSPGVQLDLATVAANVTFVRSGHDDAFNPASDVNVMPPVGPQGAVGGVAGSVVLPAGSVTVGDDPNGNEIVIRFADTLPDDLYRFTIETGLTGTRTGGQAAEQLSAKVDFQVRLGLGAFVTAVVPQPIVRTAAGLEQHRDEVHVYFNGDEDLSSISAEDVANYRIVPVSATNGDDGASVKPASVAYDAAADKAVLRFAPGAIAPGEMYRLEVGKPLAPTAKSKEFSFPRAEADENSSFSSATGLGTVGVNGITVTARINDRTGIQTSAGNVAFPRQPGTADEPGHRDIAANSGAHGLPNLETPPTLPPWVLTSGRNSPVGYYNFRHDYGLDLDGNTLFNTITEAQKQRTREIFELFSRVTGIRFVEELPPPPGVPEVYIGLTVATGDRRVRVDDGSISEPIDDGYGVSGAAPILPNETLLNASIPVAVVESNQNWGESEHGGSWFRLAMRQIGGALGLKNSYDLPSIMGYGLTGEAVFPGDYDSIHLRQLFPAIGSDVDLYRFDVSARGGFTAETVAGRPGQQTTSTVDTLLSLYREDNVGGAKIRTLVARNDDYYGRDSFIHLDLDPGTYYIAVTSTGNDQFNPEVADSGYGGRTRGTYELRLAVTTGPQVIVSAAPTAPGSEFIALQGNGPAVGDAVTGQGIAADTTVVAVDAATKTIRLSKPTTSAIAAGTDLAFIRAQTTIVDMQGTPLDGDRDGRPGGTFAFWFKTALESETVYVDKLGPQAGATGSLSAPYPTIAAALSAVTAANAATPGSKKIIRIVGNGAETLDFTNPGLAAKKAYLIGTDIAGRPLADGATFNVPKGVTVMIDEGAVFKLRSAIIDVGSSQSLDSSSRKEASLQVLGVPKNKVVFTSSFDDSIGDRDDIGPPAQGGQWGGIVFRADSDASSKRAFLNAVHQGEFRYGGGEVRVDSEVESFAPIQIESTRIESTRPTIAFNTIIDSAGAAIAATPNSFDDSNGRIGPEIRGNVLSAWRRDVAAGPWNLRQNSTNGLFIKVATRPGVPLEQLDVSARFKSTDIVYVLQENLVISGGAGGYSLDAGAGQFSSRAVGRLAINPGVVVKLQNSRIELERGAAQLIAEGEERNPVIFTSLGDTRFGAGGTFDTNGNVPIGPAAGDWGGIILNAGTRASIDRAYIGYGGGQTPTEGVFDGFNVIEVHQGDLRLANTRVERNQKGVVDGAAASDRNGRGTNAAATVFVRGAQPIIVANDFRDNLGAVISINANSLSDVSRPDVGRSTGPIGRFDRFDDNVGPLVADNVLALTRGAAAIAGLKVRGEEITVESVWDDTSIVHVLEDEIIVRNFHTATGLRLLSKPDASLVVKLRGASAGFTAEGYGLDIDDRIGGTVQVVGQPGRPVILTSLADDTIGSGLDPLGGTVRDTGNDGSSTPRPGDWRSLRFLPLSNDRNVSVYVEAETPLVAGVETNATVGLAERLGSLAPNFPTGTNSWESAQEKSGDENRRLGFEVHGFISPDDPTDVDIYTFLGVAGSEVWIDLDKTGSSLDAMVELLDSVGNVLALSADGQTDAALSASTRGPGFDMRRDDWRGGDYYTTNPRDPGMRLVLPGALGQQLRYFVRVRSQPQQRDAAGRLLPAAEYESRLRSTTFNQPGDPAAGATSGRYELRIRLRQRDEKPGSVVRYADIRYPTTGVDVVGLPRSSLLAGEAGETPAANDLFAQAQFVGNLLAADRNTISVSGLLTADSDVDWYRVSLTHEQLRTLGGATTWPTVFDIDYADGFRGDLVLSVFDEDGRLIFVGGDSDVVDDQPAAGEGADFDDLSRGSIGKLDPFIGSVHMPAGNPADLVLATATATPFGSSTVALLTGVPGAGTLVSGPGIVAGTTVLTVDAAANTVTLSKPTFAVITANTRLSFISPGTRDYYVAVSSNTRLPSALGATLGVIDYFEKTLSASAAAAANFVDLEDVTGLVAGMPVLGVGIAAGTTIASVNVATGRVTLSSPVTQLISRGTRLAFSAGPALTRFEPINSLRRIAEDHIGSTGYVSGQTPDTVPINPLTELPLIDVSSASKLSLHVRPFRLADVTLFVSGPGFLATYDAVSGAGETVIRQEAGAFVRTTTADVPIGEDSIPVNLLNGIAPGMPVYGVGIPVGTFVVSVDPLGRVVLSRKTDSALAKGSPVVFAPPGGVGDLDMRTDGRLYAYAGVPLDSTTVGRLLEYDTGTGEILFSDFDEIDDQTLSSPSADQTTSDSVTALAFRRTGALSGPSGDLLPAQYGELWFIVNDGGQSKLYRAASGGTALQGPNPNPDAAANQPNTIDDAGYHGRIGIDFTGDGDFDDAIDQQPLVTGLQFVDDVGNTLYGVTADGKFIRITPNRNKLVDATEDYFAAAEIVVDFAPDLARIGARGFTALAAAPRNLEGQSLRGKFFALTDTGRLALIDLGDPQTGIPAARLDGTLGTFTDTGETGGFVTVIGNSNSVSTTSGARTGVSQFDVTYGPGTAFTVPDTEVDFVGFEAAALINGMIVIEDGIDPGTFILTAPDPSDPTFPRNGRLSNPTTAAASKPATFIEPQEVRTDITLTENGDVVTGVDTTGISVGMVVFASQLTPDGNVLGQLVDDPNDDPDQGLLFERFLPVGTLVSAVNATAGSIQGSIQLTLPAPAAATGVTLRFIRPDALITVDRITPIPQPTVDVPEPPQTIVVASTFLAGTRLREGMQVFGAGVPFNTTITGITDVSGLVTITLSKLLDQPLTRNERLAFVDGRTVSLDPAVTIDDRWLNMLVLDSPTLVGDARTIRPSTVVTDYYIATNTGRNVPTVVLSKPVTDSRPRPNTTAGLRFIRPLGKFEVFVGDNDTLGGFVPEGQTDSSVKDFTPGMYVVEHKEVYDDFYDDAGDPIPQSRDKVPAGALILASNGGSNVVDLEFENPGESLPDSGNFYVFVYDVDGNPIDFSGDRNLQYDADADNIVPEVGMIAIGDVVPYNTAITAVDIATEGNPSPANPIRFSKGTAALGDNERVSLLKPIYREGNAVTAQVAQDGSSLQYIAFPSSSLFPVSDIQEDWVVVGEYIHPGTRVQDVDPAEGRILLTNILTVSNEPQNVGLPMTVRFLQADYMVKQTADSFGVSDPRIRINPDPNPRAPVIEDLHVGMIVMGHGIPYNARIQSIGTREADESFVIVLDKPLFWDPTENYLLTGNPFEPDRTVLFFRDGSVVSQLTLPTTPADTLLTAGMRVTINRTADGVSETYERVIEAVGPEYGGLRLNQAIKAPIVAPSFLTITAPIVGSTVVSSSVNSVTVFTTPVLNVNARDSLIGNSILGVGIPAGTIIKDVQQRGSVDQTELVLSKEPAAIPPGTTVRVLPNVRPKTSADVAAGQTVVRVASTAGILPRMSVFGDGIDAGTTVVGVNALTGDVTLSRPTVSAVGADTELVFLDEERYLSSAQIIGNLADTSVIRPQMLVFGDFVQPGTVVDDVPNSTTVVVDRQVFGDVGAVDDLVFVLPAKLNQPDVTRSGAALTSGQPIVSSLGVGGTSTIREGMLVFAAGDPAYAILPFNTRVQSVNADGSITLTKAPLQDLPGVELRFVSTSSTGFLADWGNSQFSPVLAAGATGLAFSPLDVNLWHPTERRGDDPRRDPVAVPDPGHGVAAPPDDSRAAVRGGKSMYFGLETWQWELPDEADLSSYDVYESERQQGQLGVYTYDWQHDLTIGTGRGDSYDLPGGAFGSLTTNPFSLAGYTSSQKPTLYFNYWLQTEVAAGDTDSRSMRDSARVFISRDSGLTWELVATNNSDRGSDLTELPLAPSVSSQLNPGDSRQQVQELFDAASWRQARIDLGGYAGQADLRLRFDFHTAGQFDPSVTTNASAAVASGQTIIPVASTAGLIPGMAVSGAGITPGSTVTFVDAIARRVTLSRPTVAALAAAAPLVFVADPTGRVPDLASRTGNFNDAERGVNNRFEGFYVDDIIVGLAGRGEMVTGDLGRDISRDTTFVAANEVPGAPRQVLDGPYQLEIRRGTEYASQLPDTTRIVIDRQFGVADRLVPSLPTATGALRGDSNQPREQGQFIIESNFISYARDYGISIDAGPREASGAVTRPGAVQNYATLNGGRLVPGALVVNNVIELSEPDSTGSSIAGIRFSGDAEPGAVPPAVVPHGRIVNNTIYGGSTARGVGVVVTDNAGPTLMNNLFAGLATGVSVDASSSRDAANNERTVVTHSAFHNVSSRITGVTPQFSVGLDADPFEHAAGRNFYLRAGVKAIDTSLDSLQDRNEFRVVKAPLGVPPAPVLAPEKDLYGQLRADDPALTPSLPGLGAETFKDIGAIDRVDFSLTPPFLTLVDPLDNGPLDRESDTDLVALEGEAARGRTTFALRISDPGAGIDAATVTASAFDLLRDGILLESGKDYVFAFHESTNRVVFTAASVFRPGTYTIKAKSSIQDIADNPLRPNPATGKTEYVIALRDVPGAPVWPGAMSPVAPAPLSVAGWHEDRTIHLGWNAAFSVLPITDYDVEMSTDAFTSDTRVVTPASDTTSTTLSESGLTNGRDYWFRVRAKNSLGAGPWSDVLGPIVPHPRPSLDLAVDTGSSPTDGITRDPRVTVSGLAAGATWEFRHGGGSWNPGSGTSFTLPQGTFAAGAVQVRQIVKGFPGVPATNPARWEIDTDAPNAPVITAARNDAAAVIPDNGFTSDTTPTLSGTADAGVQVTVYSGGMPLGDATPGSPWTFTTSPLGQGTYAFTAVATDIAGNVSPASNNYNITVLTGTPAAPVITRVDDDFDPVRALVPQGGTTDDRTPLLSGTADVDDVVRVYAGIVELGTATRQGSAWEFLVTTPLLDGPVTFTARAFNKAGTPSDFSAGYTITIDTTPPAPVITGVFDDVAPVANVTIPDGGFTNDTRPMLSGTAQSGSTVEIWRNGAHFVTLSPISGTTWTFTPSVAQALGDESHTFTARALSTTSVAGAFSTPYRFTVDTVAPRVTGIRALSPSGTYGIDEWVDIEVTFGEPVLPVGTPQLALNTNPARVAEFEPGGNVHSQSLTFRYWIKLGDSVARLDYASIAALAGAEIRDRAGNAAVVDLASPGAFLDASIEIDALIRAIAFGLGRWPDTPDFAEQLTTIDVEFNVEVTGVTRSAIRLERLADPNDRSSGRPVSLDAVSVVGDGKRYTITFPSSANPTSLPGRYKLIIGGLESGIESGGVEMDIASEWFFDRPPV